MELYLKTAQLRQPKYFFKKPIKSLILFTFEMSATDAPVVNSKGSSLPVDPEWNLSSARMLHVATKQQISKRDQWLVLVIENADCVNCLLGVLVNKELRFFDSVQ